MHRRGVPCPTGTSRAAMWDFHLIDGATARGCSKNASTTGLTRRQGSLGMSGTYTVSGNVLTFKVEASTYPNSEGTEQKRTITHFRGDELRYSNQAPTNPGGGTAVIAAGRLK